MSIKKAVVCLWLASSLFVFTPAVAQQLDPAAATPAAAQTPPPPAVILVTGKAQTLAGLPKAGTVLLRMSLYAGPEDTAAIWFEDQQVTLDAIGGYAVYFGATRADGVPPSVFTYDEARWLGVSIDGAPEQPRTLVLSVPYASKAAAADTLAGKRPEDFLLSENLRQSVLAAFREVNVVKDGQTQTFAGSGEGELTMMSSTTPNAIVKYLDSSGTEGEAAIIETMGRVGIGTLAPQGKLDVRGAAEISHGYPIILSAQAGASGAKGGNVLLNAGPNGTGATNGYIAFGIGSGISEDQVTGRMKLNSERMRIDPDGKVGINTIPAARLHIKQEDNNFLGGLRGENSGGTRSFFLWADGTGDARVHFDSGSDTNGDVVFNAPTVSGTGSGKVGIGESAPVTRLDVRQATIGATSGIRVQNAAGDAALYFWADTANRTRIDSGSNGGGTLALNAPGGGNVGIGMTDPQARLDVNGETRTTTLNTTGPASIAGTAVIQGAVSMNAGLTVTGNVTVSGNIAAKYQDVAEWVEASEPLRSATLVSADPARNNRVRRSRRAYDTAVLGVVSAQPGVLLGEPGEGKVAVAQSGRVKVKVNARYGAIRRGDLLVTSPIAGVAMRSRPTRSGLHRPGTIVGKALEPLAKGTGEILVLLTLQ